MGPVRSSSGRPTSRLYRARKGGLERGLRDGRVAVVEFNEQVTWRT